MRIRPTVHSLVPSLSIIVLAAATGLHAQPVTVPNHSFEGPDASLSPLPAVPDMESWTRTGPVIDMPNFGVSGVLAAGVFANPDEGSPGHIVGVDGLQMAFIQATDPSNIPVGESPISIHQTLDHRFELGKYYALTIGVAPAGDDEFQGMNAPRTYNPNEGAPPDPAPAELTFRLFFEQDQQRLTVAVGTVLSTQLEQNLVIDFELISDTVGASDPWLNQLIGIEIAPTLGLSGFWNVDNVRLVEVPEPATATLLALSGLVLIRRRRA